MPTYTFKCLSCKQIFRLFMTIQQRQENRNPVCPYCQSTRVELVIEKDLPFCT